MQVDLRMPTMAGVNPLIPETWESLIIVNGATYSLGDIGIVEDARAEDVQAKAIALFKEVLCRK